MPDRIYCYPDSDVLKNKMGVRDSERLSQLERRLTMLRLLELIDKPIRGKFGLTHLQAILWKIERRRLPAGVRGRRSHKSVGILFFRNQCPASLPRRKWQKPA